MHDACGVGSNVSEALNGDRGILDVQFKMAEGLERHTDHPATGSFVTSKTPAAGAWFAGNDTRHGEANLRAVGVDDPGRDLCVGYNVGSRDILVLTDARVTLGGMPATP